MMWEDIVLATDVANRYGVRLPLYDFGGLDNVTVADYMGALDAGDQSKRYFRVIGRPFAHLARDYKVVNPELGDLCIEDFAARNPASVGMFTCMNVLEHVTNPDAVFRGFRQMLRLDGYGIVHTLLSFPIHGDEGTDYWRFTPHGLRTLALRAGLRVLEFGRRLNIHGGMGLSNTATGETQEVRTVYCVVARDGFKPQPPDHALVLPGKVLA